MDPIELARRVGMMFYKAGQYIAAALIYGAALERAPDDAALLVGFGAAVAACEGQMVKKPFVQWATRIFKRCVATGNADYLELARGRLADLARKPEFVDLPPSQPGDVAPLLAFLDVQPSRLMADAVEALPDDDRMIALMALGELGSSRFASAIAAAVSGRWGERVACAALKRVRPYAAHRAVRDGMTALRASPLAEECEPYLSSAEAAVASVPITITVPEGYVKVVAPPADAPAPVSVAPPFVDLRKPWWKFW